MWAYRSMELVSKDWDKGRECPISEGWLASDLDDRAYGGWRGGKTSGFTWPRAERGAMGMYSN